MRQLVFLVEAIQKDNKSEIVVFSRDENNNKHMTYITDFMPYFYVNEDEEVPSDNRIYGVQTGFTSINGNPVKKILVYSTYDIRELKENFSVSYESDIPFSQRYIIDVVGEVPIYDLRIMYIDIELNTEHDFPDMLFPNQEVTSIAITDSFTGKSKCLLFQPDNAPNKIKTNDQVKVFNTEEKLLDALIHYVNTIDPDIISGWNVKTFDLTYLIKRMKGLGVDYARLSPLNMVKVNDKYEDVKIVGRIIMDMMEGYKFFRNMSNQGKAESYSLEFTGQEVLGVGKIKHKETFREMWIDKPAKLIEYNIRDNELVHKINEKLKIISFFNSIRSKSCSNMESIFHASVLIDGLLLNVTKGSPVLPSRQTEGGKKYDGAFVFEPVPGLYDFVLALDIKSMYPNLIKTFNIGYETIMTDGPIKITRDISFSHNEGFIPGVLTMLAKERAMYKKRVKEATTDNERQINHFRQYAVKVLANSIYGYLGFPKSRLYKREVAFAVTYMGQKLIKRTKQLVEKAGFKVIYGDTDSVYVKANADNKFGAIKQGYDLVKLINIEYKKFAEEHGAKECFLEMEFEKAFRKVLFVAKRGEKEMIGAKKRYAYMVFWKDGNFVPEHLEISGFDLVRSDTPRIAKHIQRTVLEMIIDGVDKDTVMKFLTEIDKKIRNGEISADEIGFPKGITENLVNYKAEGPVIRGAIYSNKYLGTRFGKGSKPKFLYIKSVPNGYPDTNVITYEDELPKGFIPDYDMINERIFEMKLRSIFESIGWKWTDINSNQSSMEAWI